MEQDEQLVTLGMVLEVIIILLLKVTIITTEYSLPLYQITHLAPAPKFQAEVPLITMLNNVVMTISGMVAVVIALLVCVNITPTAHTSITMELTTTTGMAQEATTLSKLYGYRTYQHRYWLERLC